MSYCAATLEACPTLQAQIDDMFNTCDSGLFMEQIPLAEFIASAQNRSNLTQTISPPNAKVRSVNLIYDQLILESAVTLNATEFCTATTKRGNCSQNYTIDPTANFTIEQLIEESDLREACLDNGEFLSREILKMMIALEHRIASAWTAQAVALAGAWNTTDIPETVSAGNELQIPLTFNTGAFNPIAAQILSNDLMMNGYCNQPFIAGGTQFFRYMQAAGLAGCCTDSGLDISAIMSQWGMAVAYDRRVKNSMGGNQFALVVQPNSVIPLYWVKHPWKDGMAIPSGSANYVNYGLLLPRLKIPVDVYFSDKCPGALHIIISAATTVVGLPEDLFPTGHHLDGLTFVNKLEATTCVDPCPS